MIPPTKTCSQKSSEVPLAIVLAGVSEKWQTNVLQILGRPTAATVIVDGYGAIEAPAILLSQDQARHLATQITELLGPEDEDHVHVFIRPDSHDKHGVSAIVGLSQEDATSVHESIASAGGQKLLENKLG